MLGYYLKEEPFALNANSTVRITFENPVCYFDEIPGDVGMGIEIPVNETNRMLLGNPDRFGRRSKDKDKEYDGFEIRFGGVLLLAGTLVVQKANKKSYSCWLRSNVGNMAKLYREKYIYDAKGFQQDKTFVNKANYDPEVDDYGCPKIFNPEFFKDKGRKITVERSYIPSGETEPITEDIETEAMSEAFRKASLYFVNALNSDNTVNVTPSFGTVSNLENLLAVRVVTPMLFLNKVLEILFADAGFGIDNNVLATNADLKRLILYNNYDITKEQLTLRTELTEIINGIWFDGVEIMPSYVVTIADILFRSYDGTFQYRDLLPKERLKDFLLGIQNMLNVVFVFKNNRKVDIIDREKIFEGEAIDIDQFLLDEWEIGEKKDVTLKFSFTQDDNDIFIKERWTDIDDRREDEKDPVETWDDLNTITAPVLGEVRYIKSMNLYVEYALIQHTEINQANGNEETIDTVGWKHLALGFQNGYFNKNKEEQEEITTVFSTVAGDQQATSYQKGNMRSMKFSYESFSPRLLFYLGNNMAKYETANLSLDWEKEVKGLLAKRWPKFNRFWSQRQPFSNDAKFSLNALDYVKRNITRRFRCMEGEFIIEKLEAEFGIDWIGNTTITGYKNAYVPMKVQLDAHWSWNNLVLDETLIDFGMVEIVKNW